MNQEILLNTTERLYLKIYVGGDLTPSEDEVTVTVYDSEGEIAHAEEVAKDQDDDAELEPGVYYVYSKLADAAKEQELTYVWSFTINGEEATKTDKVQFVTPYATLEEIREVAPDDATYDQIIVAEKYARYMINSYVGQDFGKRQETKLLYGDGKDRLLLSDRLLYINTMSENDVSVYNAESPPNEYDITISDTNQAIGLTFAPSNNVISLPHANTRRFRRGSRYLIDGVWGWDEVPHEVNLAAILLAEDFFCKEIAWRQKYVDYMQAEGWKMSFNERQFTGTGNSIADKILKKYAVLRNVGVVI